MENNENQFSELEEMRAQVALLQQKLNKETIVTDKLLRDTMKRKAHTINANAWISVGASIFVILWALLSLPSEGFSWWFIGATIIMMLVCDFFTWKYHKNVNSKTMSSDLVTVAKVMKKLRKDYQNWKKYGIAMLIVWFCWLATEYCIIIDNWKIAAATFIFLLIGVSIGCFIGLRMHNSVINNAEDIIQQIEEDLNEEQ